MNASVEIELRLRSMRVVLDAREFVCGAWVTVEIDACGVGYA